MNQKNNLVKNASFLMIAAMISKVIGLLYKSPLSNIIGSLGMGYTSLAQNAYMILLMIASFSIPQAVSKLISERIALKDYRNAHKFFKGAMIYAMVIGGVVGLFCLFGAGLIIPQNQKDAIPALQILAPTIFLSGILGVFRGYFQAYRNMMPTSISQIIEQVFNAAVSLLAAWGFINAFSDGTENSIANGGSRFHSRNRSRSGDCIGIHASGVWCKPQKNSAPGRERSQTSGRVLQRDFSCDHPGCFADYSQRLCL